MAIAVTGAPSNRPMAVDFPRFWEATPTADRVARFPQELPGATRLPCRAVVVVAVLDVLWWLRTEMERIPLLLLLLLLTPTSKNGCFEIDRDRCRAFCKGRENLKESTPTTAKEKKKINEINIVAVWNGKVKKPVTFFLFCNALFLPVL